MTNNFNIQRTTRSNILKACSELTLEQMNTIPIGFNNSIAWNLGHILVTQKLLVYGLSSNDLKIESRLVEKFKKGTKADTPVSATDHSTIKATFLSSVDLCETDFNSGLFTQFRTYPTSYNFILNTIEDAIIFNNSHEALHFGYIMAMKKNI